MKTAAFFDLDRTLISGASVIPFAVEAWRAGLVRNRELAKWGMTALSFKLVGDRGDGMTDSARAQFLGKLAGQSVEQIDEVGRAMLPGLVNEVRPESKKLVRMHHDASRDTWIVSASAHDIVAGLASTLGMTGAIGTRAIIVDGHFTDQLDGPFVYGPGKAEAIRALADERNYDLSGCYAYSDSISDLPMLETVGHPVAVNPDRALERIAYDRAWPIVIFSRRTKRVVALSSAVGTAALAVGSAYVAGRRHGAVIARR
jgi:HAD superfamily hydrolase (TIGR01490 family)